MNLKKRAKNLDLYDISLTKWSALVFALFLVSACPWFADWVMQTHWGWFLGISLLLALRPLVRFFKN